MKIVPKKKHANFLVFLCEWYYMNVNFISFGCLDIMFVLSHIYQSTIFDTDTPLRYPRKKVKRKYYQNRKRIEELDTLRCNIQRN